MYRTPHLFVLQNLEKHTSWGDITIVSPEDEKKHIWPLELCTLQIIMSWHVMTERRINLIICNAYAGGFLCVCVAHEEA